MASTFKTLSSTDTTTTRTLLNEVIPLTGTIVSGTYSNANIKNYSHGIFQSVYDYPYLSSSANHIFDLTVGYHSSSAIANSANTLNTKKINIYNQMAQVLVGHDTTGSIQLFDQDGDLTSGTSGGTKLKECIFVNFARLLTKDEVKKGSFELKVFTGSANTTPANLLTISDYGAASSFKVNSPAGEYGILYTSSATPSATSGVGLLYYQAGIAVLTASIFNGKFGPRTDTTTSTGSISTYFQTGSITGSADGFRNRLYNVQFNNTTELNSTIYFCRASHNEFNYSSNPTYLSSSKIVVKNTSTDAPVSYITTVGLYSADNELLAVAKLSEPLKKDPTNELTVRVRLDY
jgi:hypothetical protein